MKKISLFLIILLLLAFAFVGSGYLKKIGFINKLIEKNEEPKKIEFEKKYYLGPENTISVTAGEARNVAYLNDWSYKSGEWTKNKKETYASIVKFGIPELINTQKAILHLEIESYNHKKIYEKKGLKERCRTKKKFYIKKIASPWDLNIPTATSSAKLKSAINITYESVRKMQENGEIIAEFTVGPTDEYINVEIPVREIMGAYGFAIDQADESLCRVCFYSQAEINNPTVRPFIGIVKPSEPSN